MKLFLKCPLNCVKTFQLDLSCEVLEKYRAQLIWKIEARKLNPL